MLPRLDPDRVPGSGLAQSVPSARLSPRRCLIRRAGRRPLRIGTPNRKQNMTSTFADLGVSAPLADALAVQGINEPFAIQALTIADALAGRDVLGKAKTGSGKTLAFGVPLLDRVEHAEPRAPHGLVLVPTRELANQVREVLEPLGKTSASPSPRSTAGWAWTPRSRRSQVALDVFIGTPGRLIDLMERGELVVRRGAGPRPRRGRPHGRHGIPAAGAEDPPPGGRCPPDDAVLGHARSRYRPARRPLHARPGLARGRVEARRRSRRCTTASSSCTRWTR